MMMTAVSFSDSGRRLKLDLTDIRETQEMQLERQVRDDIHDHFSDSFARAWVKFFFELKAIERRRGNYLTFMKHRNRRGANVRIGVEQRKARKRAQERHSLRCSCMWMREDNEHKRESENSNAG